MAILMLEGEGGRPTADRQRAGDGADPNAAGLGGRRAWYCSGARACPVTSHGLPANGKSQVRGFAEGAVAGLALDDQAAKGKNKNQYLDDNDEDDED